MTSSNAKPVNDDRTADSPPDLPAKRRRMPRFDLSATQLVATALAAITATFLASYLGVSGTIIGAAVASVSTAIGNAVYGQSLRTTRDRVREAVPVLHARTDPGSPTIVLPVMDDAADGQAGTDPQPTLPAATRSTPQPATPATAWRRVAFVAVGMFAAVLAIVTGVEVLAGRPVTDLVRGDSGSGTTLFGVNGKTRTVQPSVPTVTMTVTPKVVITTPTVTQTAPAVTRSAPTKTPTAPATAPTTPAPSTSATTPPPSSVAPTAPRTSPPASTSPRG